MDKVLKTKYMHLKETYLLLKYGGGFEIGPIANITTIHNNSQIIYVFADNHEDKPQTISKNICLTERYILNKLIKSKYIYTVYYEDDGISTILETDPLGQFSLYAREISKKSKDNIINESEENKTENDIKYDVNIDTNNKKLYRHNYVQIDNRNKLGDIISILNNNINTISNTLENTKKLVTLLEDINTYINTTNDLDNIQNIDECLTNIKTKYNYNDNSDIVNIIKNFVLVFKNIGNKSYLYKKFKKQSSEFMDFLNYIKSIHDKNNTNNTLKILTEDEKKYIREKIKKTTIIKITNPQVNKIDGDILDDKTTNLELLGKFFSADHLYLTNLLIDNDLYIGDIYWSLSYILSTILDYNLLASFLNNTTSSKYFLLYAGATHCDDFTAMLTNIKIIIDEEKYITEFELNKLNGNTKKTKNLNLLDKDNNIIM